MAIGSVAMTHFPAVMLDFQDLYREFAAEG